MPECEWSAARNSLANLATSLERVEKELFSSIRFADQAYIQETRLYYDTIVGKLRRAGDLFLPGRPASHFKDLLYSRKGYSTKVEISYMHEATLE